MSRIFRDHRQAGIRDDIVLQGKETEDARFWGTVSAQRMNRLKSHNGVPEFIHPLSPSTSLSSSGGFSHVHAVLGERTVSQDFHPGSTPPPDPENKRGWETKARAQSDSLHMGYLPSLTNPNGAHCFNQYLICITFKRIKNCITEVTSVEWYTLAAKRVTEEDKRCFSVFWLFVTKLRLQSYYLMPGDGSQLLQAASSRSPLFPLPSQPCWTLVTNLFTFLSLQLG